MVDDAPALVAESVMLLTGVLVEDATELVAESVMQLTGALVDKFSEDPEEMEAPGRSSPVDCVELTGHPSEDIEKPGATLEL